MNPTRLMVLAVLLALAGCDGAAGSGGPQPRYLNPAGSCPGVDASAERLADQPLPGDFRPVSVVLCDLQPEALASRAGGTIRPPAVRRSIGPFDDLVRALRGPLPEPPRGEFACPAMLQAPMLLALTDASGRTVLPAIPATECGFRTPAVDSAVRALSWE
ncbi:hypothetical protein QLQ12_34555 [Actinoplanes sp. NEAU-A12]|uniref:Secreted protein n=1 Tax=Actinoplanes sandaracinus TaxID=3045177 RepID=A0ABT6WVH6_9ACTN|nr:hypothetical protein [Actinoplanes sandaracinus]MDI6103748.1 hypothetical protein [Actinoplanes sandaracinus]